MQCVAQGVVVAASWTQRKEMMVRELTRMVEDSYFSLPGLRIRKFCSLIAAIWHHQGKLITAGKIFLGQRRLVCSPWQILITFLWATFVHLESLLLIWWLATVFLLTVSGLQKPTAAATSKSDAREWRGWLSTCWNKSRLLCIQMDYSVPLTFGCIGKSFLAFLQKVLLAASEGPLRFMGRSRDTKTLLHCENVALNRFWSWSK